MTGSTARRESERRRLEAGVNRRDDGARAASKVRAPQQAILSSGSRRFEVSEGWEVHRASELLAPRMRLLSSMLWVFLVGRPCSHTLRLMGPRYGSYHGGDGDVCVRKNVVALHCFACFWLVMSPIISQVPLVHLSASSISLLEAYHTFCTYRRVAEATARSTHAEGSLRSRDSCLQCSVR